jgi:hypothetical protein
MVNKTLNFTTTTYVSELLPFTIFVTAQLNRLSTVLTELKAITTE